MYKGVLYPSSEHAYVSAKSEDLDFKVGVLNESEPGGVKKLGRNLEKEGGLVENWGEIKLSVMEEILRDKFSDPHLKNKLLSTEDKILYEGNWWHDDFWGVDDKTGKGQNNLGKLLMKIRSEFKYKSIL